MFFYREISAPAGPIDEYFANVSLLLKGDGQNNTTNIIDTSLNEQAVTVNGGAKHSTSVFKYGGSSIAFDGDGDYLTVANNTTLNFGSSDNFTVEGWIYCNTFSGNSSPDYGISLVNKGTNSTNSGWTLYIYEGNSLYFGVPYVSNDVGTSFAFSTNTWYHLACTRNNGTIRLFVNGNLVASQINNTTNYTTTEELRVGRSHSNGQLNGYVDDLRITKGAARYTDSFTPPGDLPTPSITYVTGSSNFVTPTLTDSFETAEGWS